MSGCQRCLVCGCLAVGDVLCADVWLSAMSCNLSHADIFRPHLMMCTNMTTILSHQEDLDPSMLDIKYEGLGGTGLVTTPLIMAPNLSECNVSHGGIALKIFSFIGRLGRSDIHFLLGVFPSSGVAGIILNISFFHFVSSPVRSPPLTPDTYLFYTSLSTIVFCLPLHLFPITGASNILLSS